ncbi:MAG: hypothetical protein A3B89_02915 [Candidatus Buchananbacteria bacterium RIFCSPHIGHO2_02_FULL_40_13]|uniref:Uncharacterized protein n=1 Tax=Candidatus Buchananbacteria bacterium RIFCSPLOWO2_01_FULL_39_33 TaxID=1797543 RepID=A0A1G1YHX6_9BACT|nr:MAG: hypothetical protein A2820_02075 [Candidatus Buchananbacteria bacterium RIFCSPHIGHO2_01_FULL_40_35]OGY49949.1 MAG: hypothetical protein A3B89_02915 [Candidatus Buchananbacteria bacterium RIFCSPHIGHO2_02_FULL_40_13]OGY51909.1 MAG: hypothetical protein A3A02_01165 [Candidatus Buchananbacteria bacterium RIFCSPLOWO2_01_FULL_39_33]
MINIKHLLKVTAAWTSIVYVVCFAGVALFPATRELFMRYALHSDIALGRNIITLATFIAGLIIWNVIDVVAVWLFAFLFNKIKK